MTKGDKSDSLVALLVSNGVINPPLYPYNIVETINLPEYFKYSLSWGWSYYGAPSRNVPKFL